MRITERRQRGRTRDHASTMHGTDAYPTMPGKERNGKRFSVMRLQLSDCPRATSPLVAEAALGTKGPSPHPAIIGHSPLTVKGQSGSNMRIAARIVGEGRAWTIRWPARPEAGGYRRWAHVPPRGGESRATPIQAPSPVGPPKWGHHEARRNSVAGPSGFSAGRAKT